MSTPLYDHAAEAAVIDVLATSSALDVGRARVLAEQCGLVAADFHSPAIAEVWEASLTLLRKGQPADLLLVENATRASTAVTAAGGRKFLAPMFTGAREEFSLPGLSQALRD